MHIVLLEPEIPPNTGNVARLCAATRSALHLIEPFGFKLDDAALKRAGMDYWQQLTWHRWKNWGAFLEKVPATIHERTPLYIGNREEVEAVAAVLRG